MAFENDKFNSISDLYKRILPALETKVSEFKRDNFSNVETLDIWNYCVNTKWKFKSDLRIYEIVDDILNIKINNLEEYIKSNKSNDKDE